MCARLVTSFRLEETVSGVMTLAVWEITPVLLADESGVSWAGCEDRSAQRWRWFSCNTAPCGVFMMYDLGVTHSFETTAGVTQAFFQSSLARTVSPGRSGRTGLAPC